MSINREPLIKLSESLSLSDSTDMPISIGDAVLMRSAFCSWVPCVYMGYDDEPLDWYPFRSGEAWYSIVAPFAGNEERAGTKEDCHGTIDSFWMREKGLIE